MEDEQYSPRKLAIDWTVYGAYSQAAVLVTIDEYSESLAHYLQTDAGWLDKMSVQSYDYERLDQARA